MFELRRINNVRGQLCPNISQSIARGCCCLCWLFARLTPRQPGRWPNRWQCSHSPTENTPSTHIATLQFLDFKCFTDFPAVLVVIIHWWEKHKLENSRSHPTKVGLRPQKKSTSKSQNIVQWWPPENSTAHSSLFSFSEEGNFLACLCKYSLPWGNFVTLTSWIPL